MWLSSINSASATTGAGLKAATGTTAGEATQSFATFLKDSINKVNNAQLESDVATQKLVNGENVDLHTVMITAEKASVSLNLALQVRNKAVEAYKETMNMQL